MLSLLHKVFPAPARVEICYASGDYWFRCPSCDTLNVNGEVNEARCPDCGQRVTYPEISLCDCKPHDVCPVCGDEYEFAYEDSKGDFWNYCSKECYQRGEDNEQQ